MRKRNIHIIIATTLFAVLLWSFVSLSEQYQINVTAALVIQSLPPGKAISSNLPREVKLTLNDNGWRLAKLTANSNIKLIIDLNTMPSYLTVLTLRDFSEQLGGRLGIQPISMSPESVYITLDELATKRVPVEARYTATFRDGYGQVGGATMQPETVTISGARSILGQIERWPTAQQTFDQVRHPIDAVVSLNDSISSLAFTPERVSLRLNVQQFAEKDFPGIPIEFVSVPPNREIILSSSKLDVFVRGGIDQLAHVNSSSFRVIVDYRVILEDTSGFIEPEIISPAGIQVVRRTPERLQYVIRKKTEP